MHTTYTYPRFAYRRSSDQDQSAPARHPLVVVGAGPVGLSAAIDLALQGLPVVLLDQDDTVSIGSRALCYAKRTLEIWDRLGAAAPILAKGVSWQTGKVFHQADPVYEFDLLPDSGHKHPAFVNLQQYYLEQYLTDRARTLPSIDLRWKHAVTEVRGFDDFVRLRIDTPDGPYELEAQWLVAADGARSAVRRSLGLSFQGQVFRDRFLIADVVMQAEFPPERWFWFDPPFHPGQSALLHREADNVWRIDLQLGWDADPELEATPERVVPRLKAMLGEDRPFELEWVSVYTFQCRRLDRFVHGRVIFAGDSAHQVSPFGARGANSGVQDAENLAWKLGLVLQGAAPASLLDSYDTERGLAADENILLSTRSTDFITPKGSLARAFRDAALELARDHPFARRLVNSGRLSTPSIYRGSRLNTPDLAADRFPAAVSPGAPCLDAPLLADNVPSWLLDHLGGDFVLLVFQDAALPLPAFRSLPPSLRIVVVWRGATEHPPTRVQGLTMLADPDGTATDRYGADGGACYLVRPDQHVAMRRRSLDRAEVEAALARATGTVAGVREHAA